MEETTIQRFPLMRRRLIRLAVAVCFCAPSWGQKNTATDLTQASLEDLANMQVTSVSKKEQSLSKAGQRFM